MCDVAPPASQACRLASDHCLGGRAFRLPPALCGFMYSSLIIVGALTDAHGLVSVWLLDAQCPLSCPLLSLSSIQRWQSMVISMRTLGQQSSTYSSICHLDAAPAVMTSPPPGTPRHLQIQAQGVHDLSSAHDPAQLCSMQVPICSQALTTRSAGTSMPQYPPQGRAYPQRPPGPPGPPGPPQPPSSFPPTSQQGPPSFPGGPSQQQHPLPASHPQQLQGQGSGHSFNAPSQQMQPPGSQHHHPDPQQHQPFSQPQQQQQQFPQPQQPQQQQLNGHAGPQSNSNGSLGSAQPSSEASAGPAAADGKQRALARPAYSAKPVMNAAPAAAAAAPAAALISPASDSQVRGCPGLHGPVPKGCRGLCRGGTGAGGAAACSSMSGGCAQAPHLHACMRNGWESGTHASSSIPSSLVCPAVLSAWHATWHSDHHPDSQHLMMSAAPPLP